MKLNTDIVLSNLRRTPFAQISKSLGSYEAHHLGLIVAKDIIAQSGIKKEDIDFAVVGECMPSQPNSARVVTNLLGLADQTPALTVSNNCVSSMDAVAEACRRIELKESELSLALGEESLTSMPIVIKGTRNNKKTSTLDKLVKYLPDQLPEGVRMVDALESDLAGDGETSFGMHVTAELVAQKYNLSREISDKIAYQSFKRAYDATNAGKYKPFLITVKNPTTEEELSADESVMLRKGIVENPNRLQKATLLFDNPTMKFDEFKQKYAAFIQKSHGPTVSMFNACPRSDGASGVLVSSAQKAKELGLKPQGRITGFRMKGVHPNYMGVGQAEASLSLLKDMGLTMDDIDQVEIHEAFAATCICALEELKKQTGYDWEKKFDEGSINAYGGSIALGHPFGATGIRLLGNAIMNFQEKPQVKRVLTTACAHGGVAGAMIVERI